MIAYIKIIRPLNTAITGTAVALGIWLTGGGVFPFPPEAVSFDGMPLPFGLLPANIPDAPGVLTALGITLGITGDCWIASLLLTLAAMAATAYGNVINDILDMKSDRVSHPSRPLVDGTMTARAAKAFAAALAAASLACGAMVSGFYLIATLAPLILLTLYSIYFKRTRVIGNIVVSALTAYAILFGALANWWVEMLILPAILAFLLNFCRELVKDVQDAEGDKAAGWATSADLRPQTVKGLLTAASAAYMLIVLMPSQAVYQFLMAHGFETVLPFRMYMMAALGTAYALTCLIAVIPIHIYWSVLALRSGVKENAKKIETLLKLEMAAGLMALALDKGIMYFIE